MRAFILVGALLATCSSHTAVAQSLGRYHFERGLMGTRFGIVLYAPDSTSAHRAARQAFERIEDLDQRLSDYDPESEVSRRAGTAGTDRWVRVSDDLWLALAAAKRFAARTDGAFDVTVGPLTRLWRWGARRGILPTAEQLAGARASVGDTMLLLAEPDRTVLLAVSGMRLDLGGIGKGYAADAALELLRYIGFDRALVDAGGDIVAGAAPPDRAGWRVEISTVDESGQMISKVRSLAHAAVATSGDTYQFFEIDGTRYSHIVDPRTGTPLSVRRVVTVFAPSGTEADALASALSVMGPAKGLAAIEKIPDVTAQLIEWDQKTERWWMWASKTPVAGVRQ